MSTNTRKPSTVGEILIDDFMEPMQISRAALAEAMGVRRRQVADLCGGAKITAETAHVLARVFGNEPDYWLELQMRVDLWEAKRDPEQRARIEMAKPLGEAARSNDGESRASKFEVLRRVDAYVDYVALVKADTAAQAVRLAQENEDDYVWEHAGTQQFDDRRFIALDEDGNEIFDTECGDF